MDAMVPPTATQPGFVVNDDYRRGNSGNYRNDHDVVLHEIADASRAILNDVGNNSRAVLNEIGNNSRAVLNEVSGNGRAGIKETSDAGRAGVAATQGAAAGVHASIEANRADNERLHIAGHDFNALNFTETRLGIERNASEARIETLQSFSSLDKWLCDKFDNVTRDTLKGFASAERDSLNGFKDTQLQALAGFKDAQLFAAQNAAKISAELAECCCEIRGLVSSESDETRALINALNTQNIQAQLTAANQKILALQLGVKVVA